ncbi:MAG: hypothetical protein KF749_11340 [Bacteroidetes bacterium]|nr:hypothetical protein [Bacteroidota bacterium]MCW5897060.1 hypothetical protein [Bacteroidota bacterium]
MAHIKAKTESQKVYDTAQFEVAEKPKNEPRQGRENEKNAAITHIRTRPEEQEGTSWQFYLVITLITAGVFGIILKVLGII